MPLPVARPFAQAGNSAREGELGELRARVDELGWEVADKEQKVRVRVCMGGGGAKAFWGQGVWPGHGMPGGSWTGSEPVTVLPGCEDTEGAACTHARTLMQLSFLSYMHVP